MLLDSRHEHASAVGNRVDTESWCIRTHRHHSCEWENAIPWIRLATLDVARSEVRERATIGRSAHRTPPVGLREPTPILVNADVELSHDIIERALIVTGVANHDIQQETGE